MRDGGSVHRRRRLRALALSGILTAALVATASVDAAQRAIPATTNIFGAGHGPTPVTSACSNDLASWGTPPASVSFTPGSSRVLSFSSVTGEVLWTKDRINGPDGTLEGQNLNSVQGIAGIIDDSRRNYLTGVFLTDAEPADPAPPQVSIGSHSFEELSPRLREPFFIGDGLTKTGKGKKQKFNVPSKATRLFLGLTDAFDYMGDVGCFQDNTGSLSAAFVISGSTPPPAPPPDSDPQAVASVVALKGTQGDEPVAQFFRDGRWQPIGKGFELRPNDRIRTDENTTLAIEFALGGRVGVNKGSEIRITGERSAKDRDIPRLRLDKGGMWAKCQKLKEPLEIQVSGGASGIRG